MIGKILRNNFGCDFTELKEINSETTGCDKLFINGDNVIGVKAILGDFGPEELADIVEIAEELYSRHSRPVILCLAMNRTNRVLVREMEIKSEADFTIKLAVIDMSRIAIEVIKEHIANGTADDADRQVLEAMPMMVHGDERKAIRKECFGLLSQL